MSNTPVTLGVSPVADHSRPQNSLWSLEVLLRLPTIVQQSCWPSDWKMLTCDWCRTSLRHFGCREVFSSLLWSANAVQWFSVVSIRFSLVISIRQSLIVVDQSPTSCQPRSPTSCRLVGDNQYKLVGSQRLVVERSVDWSPMGNELSVMVGDSRTISADLLPTDCGPPVLRPVLH